MALQRARIQLAHIEQGVSHRHHRFAEQPRGGVRHLVALAVADGDVHAFTVDVDQAVVGRHAHVDVRMRRLKIPQARQQPQRGHADGGGDGDRRAPLRRAQLFGQVTQLAEPHVGHAKQLRAFGRERHAAEPAHQQGHAQVFFQRADLAADGGLRHVQILRGQGDAHAAAHGDKASDQIERRKLGKRIWHS
ncbi:hypothetical protein D3C86_1388490 [compost metagenome]